MLKNKKGFTLVELLAVIAILAIIIAFAFPKILEQFNQAKTGAFVTQAQSIYRGASETYMTEELTGNGGGTYYYDGTESSSTLALDDSTTVKYYIVMTPAGIVTSFKIYNEKYEIIIEDNAGVKLSDIKESELKSNNTGVTFVNLTVAKMATDTD